MKKIKFRRQFSKEQNWTPKIMDETVHTVPDQNLTIRQLLDRHSRGLPLGASQMQGEYFDTEIPRFEDLTDMVEYKKQLVKEHEALTKKIEAEQKAQAKKTEAPPAPVENKTQTKTAES